MPFSQRVIGRMTNPCGERVTITEVNANGWVHYQVGLDGKTVLTRKDCVDAVLEARRLMRRRPGVTVL